MRYIGTDQPHRSAEKIDGASAIGDQRTAQPQSLQQTNLGLLPCLHVFNKRMLGEERNGSGARRIKECAEPLLNHDGCGSSERTCTHLGA